MSAARWTKIEVDTFMSFIRRKMNQNPMEFLKFDRACEEFLHKHPNFGKTVDSIQKKIIEVLNAPRETSVSTQLRVNALYRFQIGVPEKDTRDFFVSRGSAHFDVFDRIIEYSDLKGLDLGEPYPNNFFNLIYDVASMSLATRTHEDLYQICSKWRAIHGTSPVTEEYLKRRVKEVYDFDTFDLAKYADINVQKKILVWMMTETRIDKDLEGKLNNCCGNVQTDRPGRITHFISTDGKTMFSKTYSKNSTWLIDMNGTQIKSQTVVKNRRRRTAPVAQNNSPIVGNDNGRDEEDQPDEANVMEVREPEDDAHPEIQDALDFDLGRPITPRQNGEMSKDLEGVEDLNEYEPPAKRAKIQELPDQKNVQDTMNILKPVKPIAPRIVEQDEEVLTPTARDKVISFIVHQLEQWARPELKPLLKTAQNKKDSKNKPIIKKLVRGIHVAVNKILKNDDSEMENDNDESDFEVSEALRPFLQMAQELNSASSKDLSSVVNKIEEAQSSGRNVSVKTVARAIENFLFQF